MPLLYERNTNGMNDDVYEDNDRRWSAPASQCGFKKRRAQLIKNYFQERNFGN